MHTRQSGAAHVPIMFFLILLVMFLGAVVFAYVQTDQNTNLRETNQQLRAEHELATKKIVLYDYYIRDLGNVLKVPGKYTRPANVSDESVGGQTMDNVEGVMSPDDIRQKINALGSTLELPATNGLDDFLSSIATKFNALKGRVADAERARDDAMTTKAETDRKFAEATSSHSDAARGFASEIEQTMAQHSAMRADRDQQISALQDTVRQRDDTLLSEREERAVEKKGLQNEIGLLEMQNDALVNRDRLRNPISVADGRVIVARSGLSNAFINLGRKDMLQPGTVFRITNKDSDRVKAHAKVVRVEQDKAEVALSGVVDPLGDPVREGDLLYNELYSPGKYNKRTIYLMGRFSYPYNKPQLVALLRDLGNEVVDKMQPGVNTVILGDKIPTEEGDGLSAIEDSEEYKLALRWGVEFAPVRKIRDLIEL